MYIIKWRFFETDEGRSDRSVDDEVELQTAVVEGSHAVCSWASCIDVDHDESIGLTFINKILDEIGKLFGGHWIKGCGVANVINCGVGKEISVSEEFYLGACELVCNFIGSIHRLAAVEVGSISHNQEDIVEVEFSHWIYSLNSLHIANWVSPCEVEQPVLNVVHVLSNYNCWSHQGLSYTQPEFSQS